MSDMTHAIAPKSDQLNADDLIAGPRTVTITQVRVHHDSIHQPLAIHFNGEDGKPYKPSRAVRVYIASHWGKDTSKWLGKSLTMFRQPNATLAGQVVGAIRVSCIQRQVS